MLVLGFERIQKNTFILDVVLRKEEDKYTLVLPELDGRTLDIKEMDFIDVDSYKEKGYEDEKVDFNFYKINSDGRVYGLMKLSKMRRGVIFRIVNERGNDYVARFSITPYVVGKEKNEKIPAVYKKEDGTLELEYLEDIIRANKVVKVEQVTPLLGGTFDDWDNLEDQVNNGLHLDIIKEAGDCEIGLAVVEESPNL